LICMFWSKSKKPKLIPVLPKNYRKISLTAIKLASDPHVLINKREIYDFSEQGPQTQEGIRGCLDFEIKESDFSTKRNLYVAFIGVLRNQRNQRLGKLDK